jgi:hypothetical protein
MSGPGLFAAGVAVTLLVAAALALLVWGAILDGRENARQKSLPARDAGAANGGPAGNVHALPEPVPPHAA